MVKKLSRILLYLLLMMISPLLIAAIASAVFIATYLVSGESFSVGMQALMDLYRRLLPFLPYLTGGPAILVLLAFIFRNPRRIQSWFQKG